MQNAEGTLLTDGEQQVEAQVPGRERRAREMAGSASRAAGRAFSTAGGGEGLHGAGGPQGARTQARLQPGEEAVPTAARRGPLTHLQGEIGWETETHSTLLF